MVLVIFLFVDIIAWISGYSRITEVEVLEVSNSVSAVLNDVPSPIFDITPEIAPIPIKPVDQSLFIKNFIEIEAIKRDLDPRIVLWIVEKESQFFPLNVGDKNYVCKKGTNKGRITPSRGLFQISNCSHYEVSDEVAFSITGSTNWSLDYMRKNGFGEWSVYKNRFIWYKDFPYPKDKEVVVK